ncbi:MAG TPA: 50S ribosomal protein L10, partial [Xylella taiwanensis]
LKSKVVSLGGVLYPASHVDVLASLPTRLQALAMLARVLSEPITLLARVVNAVADEKQGGAVLSASETSEV